MANDTLVSEHYQHGDLLNAIREAVTKLGKTTDSITIDDLAPVDEFHIGGRVATNSFLDQLGFEKNNNILDIGCGLGGAARYVANRYDSKVTGIDLTPEYIMTGRSLNTWVNLDDQVTLQEGSALAIPFSDGNFDGGYMMHVGMNIEDKMQLFSEIARVLKPGASFGVYDVMRINDGELAFPVPWATDDNTNKLGTVDQYKQAMSDAGLEISAENNRRDFALEFFRQMKAKTEAAGGPPPLGLHTLMKDTTPAKLKNMIDNIAGDLVAPVEIIARKI